MVKHSRFPIEGDKSDFQSLGGDVRVLLLGFEDLFYHGEFPLCPTSLLASIDPSIYEGVFVQLKTALYV
jgi:hypothetical protein